MMAIHNRPKQMSHGEHRVNGLWPMSNGSVLCDKYLRHNKCTRLNCPGQHREAKPDEIRPLCYSYFKLKDGCTHDERCALSHSIPPTPPGTLSRPVSSDSSGGTELESAKKLDLHDERHGRRLMLPRNGRPTYSDRTQTKMISSLQVDLEKDEAPSIMHSNFTRGKDRQLGERGMRKAIGKDDGYPMLLKSTTVPPSLSDDSTISTTIKSAEDGSSHTKIMPYGNGSQTSIIKHASTARELSEEASEVSLIKSQKLKRKKEERRSKKVRAEEDVIKPCDSNDSIFLQRGQGRAASKAVAPVLSKAPSTETLMKETTLCVQEPGKQCPVRKAGKHRFIEPALPLALYKCKIPKLLTKPVPAPGTSKPPLAMPVLPPVPSEAVGTKELSSHGVAGKPVENPNARHDLPTIQGLSKDAKAGLKPGVQLEALLQKSETPKPGPQFVGLKESTQPGIIQPCIGVDIADPQNQVSPSPYHSIFSPDGCQLGLNSYAGSVGKFGEASQPSSCLVAQPQSVPESPENPTPSTTSSSATLSSCISTTKPIMGRTDSSWPIFPERSNNSTNNSDISSANDVDTFHHQIPSWAMVDEGSSSISEFIPKKKTPDSPGEARRGNHELASSGNRVDSSLAAHLQRPGQLLTSNAQSQYPPHNPPTSPGFIRRRSVVQEWELLRCFNCFSPNHSLRECPDRRRSVLEKEELRDFHGIINRRWTELILERYADLAQQNGFFNKHVGYRRIWSPYMLNGATVTPFVTFLDHKNRDEDTRVSRGNLQTRNEQKSQEDRNSVQYTAEDATLDHASQLPAEHPDETFAIQERSIAIVPQEVGYEKAFEQPSHSLPAPAQHYSPNDWSSGGWREDPNHVPDPTNSWAWDLAPTTSSDSSDSLRKRSSSYRRRGRRACLPSLANAKTIKPASVYCLAAGREEFLTRDDLSLPSPDTTPAPSAETFRETRVDFVDSGLNQFPVELLLDIFTYVADNVSADAHQRVKDVIAGSTFDAMPELNKGRTRNLSGVVRTCHRFRLVAQGILFKDVNLVSYKDVKKFTNAITKAPELANIVQIVRINLENKTGGLRNERITRFDMPSTGDGASQFIQLVESCPNIQVLSVLMPGCLLGFGCLDGQYPNLRELQLKDIASTNQVLSGMWDMLKQFPNVRRLKLVHSTDNSGVEFDPLAIPPHRLLNLLSHEFSKLSTLTLENAPEISDDVLKMVVPRLPQLNKLSLVHCKLVTSGGLAQTIKEMPNKLVLLTFWVWVSNYGRPTEKELEHHQYHLCRELRDNGDKLEYLNLRLYRTCGDLWKECDFRQLRRAKIHMAQYQDCKQSEATRNEKAWYADYEEARGEGGLPRLSEEKADFKLRSYPFLAPPEK